ncbi:ArsC family reductase [Limnohabitans sp.]|uniref:ArsC family reductase n=1 Tax=Limnohabitans sp. TaxID=1907725 RepID=UPI002899FE46|nr:ArsC family reductase [Limnohabitans sp.]
MHSIVYGIPNCDTVKKARTWLADHGIEFTFHDFKKQGVPSAELDTWLEAAGWETLLNRKGTTWRKLDAAVQAGVTDSASAKHVMLAHASTIKRPVITWPSGRVTVGFSPEQWPA